MPAPLSPEATALIDRPNFAHLATLMADGSPHSVPVWVGREGDRLLVCTSEGRGGAASRPGPQDHGSRVAQVHREAVPDAEP